MIFHAVFFGREREKHGAVQMSEDYFIHAVVFEKRGKQAVLALEVEGRIMDQRNRFVPLLPQRLHRFESEAEALRFAKVQLLVLFGVIGAARTRPPAGTDDHVFPEPHSVRL